MRFDPNDYVDVQERITEFWKEHPDGAIRTELASPASSFTEVVFRAEIYKHRDHERPDSVGYAAEKPGKDRDRDRLVAEEIEWDYRIGGTVLDEHKDDEKRGRAGEDNKILRRHQSARAALDHRKHK